MALKLEHNGKHTTFFGGILRTARSTLNLTEGHQNSIGEWHTKWGSQEQIKNVFYRQNKHSPNMSSQT